MAKYIDVPAVVENMEDAVEVVRVWMGEGDSIVALRNVFGENDHNWGIVLADIAVHIARMRQELDEVSLEKTFAAIHEGYRERLGEFHSVDHSTLGVRN